MNAREVIKRPLITEKSMRQNSEDNKVTFEVARTANKVQVALAIKEIYGVKPVKVNVINVLPKTKRVGRFTGKTSAYRKAIVKLPEGADIELFNSEAK